MLLSILTIFRLFFWQERSIWLVALSIFGYVLPHPTWIDRWWRVIFDKFLSIFHWECFDYDFPLHANAIIVSFRSLVSWISLLIACWHCTPLYNSLQFLSIFLQNWSVIDYCATNYHTLLVGLVGYMAILLQNQQQCYWLNAWESTTLCQFEQLVGVIFLDCAIVAEELAEALISCLVMVVCVVVELAHPLKSLRIGCSAH